MDRCHCKEYAEAVKKLKFYTVGTLRPDILEKFDRLTIELGTHLDLTSFVAGVNNQGKYIIRLNLALISHLCFDWISLLFVEKLLEGTGWSVCWIKKRIDLNMMTFEKPVALFESLSPEEVARKDRLEHMWCGYLDNYKLGQNKLD